MIMLAIMMFTILAVIVDIIGVIEAMVVIMVDLLVAMHSVVSMQLVQS